MAPPICLLNVKNLVFRGISLSIAAAIVSVFLGPLMDHHFAERQHNHSHIYLTGSVAEHMHPEGHPFEIPHSHSNTDRQGTGHHGIIYQTSNDGLHDSGTGSVIAFVDKSSLPLAGDYSSPDALTNSESILAEAFVAPPKKPPRA